MAEPIRFNNNQMPFNLPTSDLREGEDVTLVAWGRSGAGKPIHNDLQKLDAKSMLSNRCQWYHQGIMGIHNDEFCTLITKGTGTCNVRNYLSFRGMIFLTLIIFLYTHTHIRTKFGNPKCICYVTSFFIFNIFFIISC